jgi:hypothetical protein
VSARALLAVSVCLIAGTCEARQASSSGGRGALANPASVNCAQWGGTTVNRNGDRGETRYCSFADGRVSEEWALLRDKRCKPPE